MATKPQIAVAITATDELSAVLDGIKKRMATVGREAQDCGRDLDKSLAKRGLSPGQLGGSISSSIGRASMIPGLGALAGAGSIAGIARTPRPPPPSSSSASGSKVSAGRRRRPRTCSPGSRTRFRRSPGWTRERPSR